jgi:hypothetical protein
MEKIDAIRRIETGYCIFEEIQREDSEPIMNLRMQRPNNHLKILDGSIDSQSKYYERYLALRNEGLEVYYKIFDRSRRKEIAGLVRVTELQDLDRFSWESLIFAESAPPHLILDAIVSVYKIGFEILNRQTCGPWGIPLGAEKIYRLHKKIGIAEEVSRDSEYINMKASREGYQNRRNFFSKLGYGQFKF